MSAKWAPGLVARLTLRPVGPSACFEFALSLSNEGQHPVSITRADSLAVTALAGLTEALAYTSRWGDEYQPIPFTVSEARVIDVRSGRSALGHSPFLALSGPATLAVAPVWSGNWHVALDPGPDGIRLTAGLNPWKFEHVLAPGSTFREAGSAAGGGFRSRRGDAGADPRRRRDAAAHRGDRNHSARMEPLVALRG